MHSEPASIEDGQNDISEQLQMLRNSAMSAPRNTTSSQMSVRPDIFGSKSVRLPEINKGLLQGHERYSKSKYASTPKVVLSAQKDYEIYERLNEEDNSPKQIQHAQTDANQSRQHLKQSKTDYQPTSRLSSLLGRIRKDRKESQEELQIIENRVKMLKKEEEKTQKKTEQIRQKSEDIAQIKQRHALEIQKREDIMKEEADKIALAKENASKKKEKAKHLDNLGELLLRNHDMYVQTKREKELSRMIISQMTQKEIDENAKHVRKMRKKQAAAAKKIKEQKSGVEKIIERFQEDIQTEAQLKWEKDQKILKLEESEQVLIKKLQKSRNIQRQSIMHLQEITQLKPADVVIPKTSKQNTPANHNNNNNNKMPVKMFNLSQRDVLKDKDVAQSSRKGSQSVKGNRRRVYSVEQPTLADGNNNISYFKADKFLPQRRLVASQQLQLNNHDNSPEKQESIQEIINISTKSGEFLHEDPKERTKTDNIGSTPQSPALTTHPSEDNNFIQNNHPESFQSPQNRRNIDHKLFLSSGIKEEMKKYENLHKQQNAIHNKENNNDSKSKEDMILQQIYDSTPARLKQLSLIETTHEIPKKKKKRSRSIPDISPKNDYDHAMNRLNILLPTEITDNEIEKKSKKATKRLRATSKTSKREQKKSMPSVYLQPSSSPFGGLNPAQVKFLFQVSRRKPSPFQPTKAFQDMSVTKPDMVF